MTAGVINNHSKFSKATKLTKFMIYSTCKFSPSSVALLDLIDENPALFSTKPSALPVCPGVENCYSKPTAWSKFLISTQAFP